MKCCVKETVHSPLLFRLIVGIEHKGFKQRARTGESDITTKVGGESGCVWAGKIGRLSDLYLPRLVFSESRCTSNGNT